jgi:hypothetical protein
MGLSCYIRSVIFLVEWFSVVTFLFFNFIGNCVKIEIRIKFLQKSVVSWLFLEFIFWKIVLVVNVSFLDRRLCLLH